MFKHAFLVSIVLLSAIAGCGGGSPKELPIAKAAHGGTIVTLPGGQGFAEVLVESVAVDKKGGKNQFKPRIVAYFFQPDGTSEMSPGPTDVKVKIGTGENSKVVDLSKDSKEAAKYATAPSGEIPEGFVGELDANVNGTAAQVPFRIR